ncbi:PepSY-associated TM helix domain-containing protein [Sinomicrobium soli]|uniref:PepSY-associated TM helix domain-containing protein n=1 Tax=Sinomicrobium sp. N-1-3-6 TaxID=2219864 RepID=UPI000DCE167C|nr:PepSY-associated TM helix domain-containing protein [Sinomicrobium sp. N-1-3-6]RAV27455.1 PepSY domain-containing protein [Sinomicrobium sp. N-1-3-6]
MNRKSKVPAKKKGKKKKSLFNRVVAWLHLWPSIVSGIVLVFVCLTGTVIVYCDEIMDLTAGKARYVEETAGRRVSVAVINRKLEEACPGFMVSEYVFFKNPERSIRLRAFSPEERSLAMVYMNPYTGEVIKRDNTIYFFFVTAHLHASLLAGEAGHWIVTIATIIFVISTITGLVLWWPKKWTKTTRQASFTVKWKARFKRLNYDLHNVFGFYSLILCLVLGITGLIIFFPSLASLTIRATGGEITHLTEVLPKADSTRTGKDMVDFAYDVLENEYPDKEMVSIWNYDQQKLGAYVFTSGKVGLKSIENADLTIYDRYTGEKIEVAPEYIRHEATENIVWQLHMGQWWGQFGKLSTFLTGIIATTLPVTGFIIWWGRRRKKGKK